MAAARRGGCVRAAGLTPPCCVAADARRAKWGQSGGADLGRRPRIQGRRKYIRAPNFFFVLTLAACLPFPPSPSKPGYNTMYCFVEYADPR